MRAAPALWVLLLCSSPALAQQVTVAGRVVDGVTGRPLGRATVNLEPLPEGGSAPPVQMPRRRLATSSATSSATGSTALSGVTTDSDGSFRFTDIPAGRYRLVASRRGYLLANYQEHGDFFAAVIATPGSPGIQTLRFPLLPEGTVHGRVLDSSGDPVETATVTLFVQDADGSGTIKRRQSMGVQSGSSYEFSGLIPGTYYVAVSARPWFAQTGDGTPGPLDVAYPITFFGGGASESTAEPVALKAGETVAADITLSAVPSVHIHIPAQSMDGGFQFPRLTVPAFGDSVDVMLGTISRNGGSHEGDMPSLSMSVAPGTYTVRHGDETNLVSISADVTLRGTSEENAGVPVHGRVAMTDGSALPLGATLHLLPMDDRAGSSHIAFGAPGRRHAMQTGLRSRPPELKLGSDGSFHADSVAAGEYRLGIQSGGGDALLVTGAAASGAQVSNELVLGIGTGPVILAATAGYANGSVSGRVVAQDGSPESAAMVLLVPENTGASTLYRQDESDSDGSWTISNVVPGVYRVLAIRDGWDLAWKRPEVLERYMRASEPVTVVAKSSARLQRPILAQAR